MFKCASKIGAQTFPLKSDELANFHNYNKKREGRWPGETVLQVNSQSTLKVVFKQLRLCIYCDVLLEK